MLHQAVTPDFLLFPRDRTDDEFVDHFAGHVQNYCKQHLFFLNFCISLNLFFV